MPHLEHLLPSDLPGAVQVGATDGMMTDLWEQVESVAGGCVGFGSVAGGTVGVGSVEDGTVGIGAVSDGTVVEGGVVPLGTVAGGLVCVGSVEGGTEAEGPVVDGTVVGGVVTAGSVAIGSVTVGSVVSGCVSVGFVVPGCVGSEGSVPCVGFVESVCKTEVSSVGSELVLQPVQDKTSTSANSSAVSFLNVRVICFVSFPYA